MKKRSRGKTVLAWISTILAVLAVLATFGFLSVVLLSPGPSGSESLACTLGDQQSCQNIQILNTIHGAGILGVVAFTVITLICGVAALIFWRA